MLTLASSSCSSGEGSEASAASPIAPAPGPGAADGAGNMPAAPAPDDAMIGSGATPPVVPSEGPQVTDVAGQAEPEGTSPSEPGETGEEGETGADGLLPALPSAGCGQPRTLMDGNQTITSGGVSRQYFVSTPADYDSSHPHRVVFMFHWNYGSINAIVNPPDADRNTDRPFYGLGDLSDGKTIFVVPQGLISPTGGAGWENPNNRDVIFTDDMLAAVSAGLCIDTARVFTTGFSYGAGMSLALACTRPDKFRAALVYQAGFISGVDAPQCTTPIAFFESHGVDDPIIPYATGRSVLDTFTALNGCTAQVPPEPAQDGHDCISYEGCGVPTRFCTFGSGQGNPFNTSLRGHYPSAKDPGQSTSWVPAEAWAFITQF